ncbi:hypothetical protein [Streptomyces bobili]|jgi:hypothetical protein|uniref:hypothetical protein n=1 Tax=Streptomyces bobili TaxID=67280 RepID=UPI000A3867FC|nr:hypothetical protein [Streptomyces bobili]
MLVRHRLGVTAAVAAMAVGAGVVAATPASAVITGCTYVHVTGSGGHRGAAVTCKGDGTSRFQAAVTCKRLDTGYEYRHDGPPEWAWPGGGTSTVWCDLGANVIHVAYVRLS